MAGKKGPHRSAAAVNVDREVGVNIRRLRLARGVSLEALAAWLGISLQQMRKYEMGANRISSSLLWGLTRALGVRIEDLFVGVGTPGAPIVVPEDGRGRRDELEFARACDRLSPNVRRTLQATMAALDVAPGADT